MMYRSWSLKKGEAVVAQIYRHQRQRFRESFDLHDVEILVQSFSFHMKESGMNAKTPPCQESRHVEWNVLQQST